jgi:RNA polymerase sigma-70 factor, ECF subfamily
MPEHAEFIRHYEKFKDKIYTYFIYRVNFNRASAEDLTQEVFIKAFRNFEDFDESRSFGAWIYAIAKNHLVNFYRSGKNDVGLEQAMGISVDIRKQLEITDELEGIIGKISCMDEYSKEVLLMRFVDGLENAEIAVLLDKDESAIRTQISRALKKLRAEI